jgi:RimJ/RimL family protein N-acetyltransferase
MIMQPIFISDYPQICQWREQARETLRTSGFVSDSDTGFLDDPKHNYLGFYDKDGLLAFGGLTNIQWENRLTEISLIVNPDNKRSGIGSDCVDMLLDEAFNKMNLKTVTGECYLCNPGIDFWYRVIEKYNGRKTILPNRKFWNGKYYDSLYFSIDCAEYTA